MAGALGGADRFLAGQRPGERDDGLRDRVVRLGLDDRLDRGWSRSRQHSSSAATPSTLHPQDLLDVGEGEADLLVRPVQDEVTAVRDEVEQVQGLQGDLGVLDGRDVEGGHDDALVGLVEGAQHLVVEAGWGVDDHEVEVAPQGLDHPPREIRR